MRPYVLMGHSRPLTQVVYNREGDLIFTTGKDNVANIWFSSNGERLGSFGNIDATQKYRAYKNIFFQFSNLTIFSHLTTPCSIPDNIDPPSGPST